MAQNDTWDDGGFDDKDGFMDDAGASSAAPVPAPDQAAVPPTPEPAPKRIVITEPAPPIPPPPVEEKKRGAGYWTLVIAGLVLFVALGGYGLYWLFGRPTVEDELFIADEGEPSAIVHDTPASTPPTAIDTPLVTRNEGMTDSAVPAPVTRSEQQPNHSKPAPTPRKAPETSLPTTPAPSKNQPLFVVQVFSSPSRDDADEWLQMLKEKSISDGYIAEQQIKGKAWFRVRFGQFGNREDAEAAAIRFGFRQPWIARIR
ncbi:MAG: SPOR domain-containing protein ['Candidatus Kapabacteria' thiocyanatum]|uniref:SPOR domain-containing protein n=1 Tax=Candidatus Kapaibacterium thiocyanatum TaxID=1895771 RepID=A0A1M3L1C4_9BACT|nr:SPOR domain-containing protein ['Candidatus Kapabacteria' thiocyanatum]OJX58636.1 MAG: hypothetical protein BGO89_00035 ['Candidatus Kapabacteria' thiocyanatum]